MLDLLQRWRSRTARRCRTACRLKPLSRGRADLPDLPGKARILASVLVALAILGTSAQANGPLRIGTPATLDLERAEDGAERAGGLTLHGALQLPSRVGEERRQLSGLSALAFSADEGLLYAASDGGVLWHFRPLFEAQALAALEVVARYRLRRHEGRQLHGHHGDAEGLELLNARNGKPGDERLVISFERATRVGVFTRDGVMRNLLYAPKSHRNPRHYSSFNNTFEGVTLTPGHGAFRSRLLASFEAPLRGQPRGVVDFVSFDERVWKYPLGPGPNMGVTSITALDDGGLLVLERGFARLPPQLAARITYVPELPAGGGRLAPREIAVLSTAAGHRIDNFEGLARHRDNRFFIVSDDNENILQKTLLLYVSLALPERDAPPAPHDG